jgi:PDZ domain/Aspartyl protease
MSRRAWKLPLTWFGVLLAVTISTVGYSAWAQSGGAVSSAQTLPLTIPVQVASNLVYVQGHVNDSRQISVVLDTGASLSILVPAVAKEIGLHASGSAEAAGLGHGSSESFQIVENAQLKWGHEGSELQLSGQRIAILPVGYVAEQVGRPTEALFGSNVFKNFRVTIDYEGERATFDSLTSLSAVAGESIPIKILGDAPFVTASLLCPDGSRINGLFLLDSGTTGSLILNKSFLAAHPEITAGRSSVDFPSVQAVGGAIDLKLVRVAGLELGSFRLKEPIAAVPQSSTGVLSNPEIAGFIGAEIMRRFAVTWDYANQKMSLAPNSHLHDAFESDASGLRLVVIPPDYKTIHVSAVLPGSSAAEAGLRAGDIVKAFNGISDMPLWRLTNELRKPGASVVILIQRDTEVLTVTLQLRRLV